MLSFDQILEGLQIGLTPFAVCEVRGGAGLVLEGQPQASIHYVLHGQGTVRMKGRTPWTVVQDTVVLLPPRLRVTIECPGHQSVRFPEPRCRPIPGGWEWIDIGEGAPGAVLACANLDASHQGLGGLFDDLRLPIVENMAEEPAFCDAMQLLLAELARPRLGTPALATILMKQCMVLLLRRHWKDGTPGAAWLTALRKPELGKAISAMSAGPGSAFTLASLAKMSGMGRAAFCEHKTIAARVGFESRSYFSRSFRAYAGVHPIEYREKATLASRDLLAR
jgi:AraC family transcriptional activator of mtrCDE